MAGKVSGSGAINTGVRGWFGHGGSGSGGVMSNGAVPEQNFSPSGAGNRSSSVGVNGMMPANDSGIQTFTEVQEKVGRPSYAAGTKQSFRPKSSGKVSG